MRSGGITGKWIPGIHGDTPLVVAARRVLKRRLAAVAHFAPLAADASQRDIEPVHQLRVATRRSAAALRLFADVLPRKPTRRLRKLLRCVRRAAAAARRDDVHLEVFAKRAAEAPGGADPALALVLDAIRDSRRRAQAEVERAARRVPKLRAAQRKLLAPLRSPAPLPADERSAECAESPNHRPYTVAELAAARLPDLLDAVRTRPCAELREIEQVHSLRIAGKRLRYALEILAACFPAEFRSDLYPRLEAFQDRLGEVNDLAEIVQRIDALAETSEAAVEGETGDAEPRPESLQALGAAYREQLAARHAALLEWWASAESRAIFHELAAMIGEYCEARTAASMNSPRLTLRSADGAGPNLVPPPEAEHRRVAAIDVGTNSIRLVVAETDPLTGFRVIDDVKETTRLGEGLYSTGSLSEQAVGASLQALSRMRAIADGYHVERLRAIGTSAVREARNAAEFIEQARRRAGVAIEVIDADHEARLAFSSVANAFDLSDRQFATVDLGGGSAELVFSSGGLIDAVYKLPLGAVRLTEAYGSFDGRGEYRYGEMRRTVDKLIADVIRHVPDGLELLVGTGGTFTTLARMSIRRGVLHGHEGRFPFAVRGYELRTDEVSELLELLRKIPLSQRRRVPGLSARRAEIIVAGLCVVERLMEHLRVGRLRVHDGGVRDGLLAEMIDDLGVRVTRCPTAARAALVSARAFARRCRYEKPHSEHVTRLALRIFDQLASQFADGAGQWGTREHRDLLRAAGVLHDVGMLVDVARHNRHSYDMICRAWLPGWSRREIELIANIARYHRGRGPAAGHAAFSKLGDDDQRIAAHLAGILRIADGLDRLHTQNVHDVVVYTDDDRVRFDVRCEGDPAVNLKYARLKADVFEAAFRTRVELAWAAPARSAMRGRRR
ncbi:MAG: CHAD domain-containing protein [Phycisphaerae bacterium]|jgi:exopolyphosphatase/guanosine-5'-triphosphate,3'-diphosphate pyrophosphatase